MWDKQLNCPEYLREIDRAIKHEEDNADFWLREETKPKIVEIVET